MTAELVVAALLLGAVVLVALPFALALAGPDEDEERMSREWRERERGRR